MRRIALAEMQAGGLERVRGIEPLSKAWEAFVLPLNYTRDGFNYRVAAR